MRRRRLNLTIARANASAADLPRLAAPAIGSAIGVDILETLLVGELLAGKPADVGALAAELVGMLGRSGRSVQRDGKPVTRCQAETLRIVTEAVVGDAGAAGAGAAAAGGAGGLSEPAQAKPQPEPAQRIREIKPPRAFPRHTSSRNPFRRRAGVPAS